MKEIRVLSFGFQYGLAIQANFVFDVRRVRDPYKVLSLREKTGEHIDVRGHVMADPLAMETIEAIDRLLATMLPGSKGHSGVMTIAIAGYAGRYRSVVIAAEVAARLKKLHIPLMLVHREKELGRW